MHFSQEFMVGNLLPHKSCGQTHSAKGVKQKFRRALPSADPRPMRATPAVLAVTSPFSRLENIWRSCVVEENKVQPVMTANINMRRL